MGVRVRTRTSLARIHFQNANLFKDNVKEIESIFHQDDSSDIPQRKMEDHRANTFGCIISVVSFVEATANEFVEDMEGD